MKMTVIIVQHQFADEYEKGTLDINLVSVFENVTTKGLRTLKKKYYSPEVYKYYITL